MLLQVVFHYFYSWATFQCIYAPHLLSLFLRWQTFRLSPCTGYCKLQCNGHWGAYIFSNSGFSSDICPRSEIARSYGNCIFSIMRNLHTVLCGVCTSLQSYQQCRKVALSPHTHQHLLLIDFFNDDHCDQWVSHIAQLVKHLPAMQETQFDY